MRRPRIPNGRRRTQRVALAAAVVALAGCGGGGGTEDPQMKRGRAVYLANCTACHGSDPAHEGAIGPPIAGASLELLEARLLHGTYPPGYTPKRTSGAMPRFPHLEADIPALHAFLGDAAQESGG